MSENNVDQSIQREQLKGNEGARTEIFNAVFADLRSYGVSPVAVIQGGKEFNDFAPRTTQEIRDRPFLVMQVSANDSGETQIYKRRIGDDPRGSANNESFFLQNIAPEIMEQLPEHLRNVILFPNLKGRHADQRSFVEEHFPGVIMGDIHRAKSYLFTSSDLHAIADVIKIVQTYGEKWIGDPNLNLKGPSERKVYEKYKPDLQRREKGLRSTLGDNEYEELELLLEEEKELLLSEEVFFAASDVQGSNIVKMENGQLGMIDWERVNATNNPALDYCFMYAVLWDNRELQEEYLRYVLSQNQDKPNFKEYFRLDFIFNRGTGELNHWWNKLQVAQTPEEKAECEQAIGRYMSVVGDAMSKKEVWADTQGLVNDTVS